jgi:flagellar biosynthesis protein FlhG
MLNFQQDQAAGLRRLMAAPKPRIVSIISASTAHDKNQDKNHHQPRMITNLAASILGQGYEVLIMHASQDSNETCYGIDKLPTLLNVAYEESSLQEAVTNSKHGYFLAKLRHKHQVNMALDSDTETELNQIFNDLACQYEIVLVDASLNKNDVLPLKALNEGEILIQLTCQTESIKHAYTLIKQICSQLGRRSFGIIVGDATDAQAQIVFRNISQVARRFMQIELEYFGAIPNDEHLNRAAKLGRSVIDAFPLATASTAFKQIAQRLNYKYDDDVETNQASFI